MGNNACGRRRIEPTDEWEQALRLRDYAPRRPRRPEMLQQALFPYGEAWGG